MTASRRTGIDPDAQQAQVPLFEALQAYVARRPAALHVPGHKQGRWTAPEWRRMLGQGLALDLTEAPGLDDLHAPAGPILAAQSLAAAAFGAAHSFFLVGGTTAGLHALVLAACRPGQSLLLPRHTHRSVLAAAILAGVRPVYVRQGWENDRPQQPAPAQLAAALQAAESPAALLLTHPHYAGQTGDLRPLIDQAHAAGLAVLTDEAHGAHFAFAAGLPAPALTQGADATVQSLHKTGGSLTQSSVLHLQGRLDRQRLRDMLALVQSSSPSYLLMASLDLARRQLALHGAADWERTLALAAAARRRIERLPGLRCPAPSPGDPTRLLIETSACSGFAAAAHLWERHGVAVEMAAPTYILAVLTPGDRRSSIDRLIAGLADLPQGGTAPAPLGEPPWPEVVLPPREAYLGRCASVPLRSAVGRIAADFATVYPPGTLLVAPGERVTADLTAFLLRARSLGCHLPGLADPSLQTIRVVEE